LLETDGLVSESIVENIQLLLISVKKLEELDYIEPQEDIAVGVEEEPLLKLTEDIMDTFHNIGDVLLDVLVVEL
jgi:hypothetical protein